MRVALDSDANGAGLKASLLAYLQSRPETEAVDLAYLTGRQGEDYPDVALNMGKEILRKRFERGILICGTGLGMAIAANKIPGIYAGCCHDAYSAERLAKSNDAQVMTMGALVIGCEAAKKIAEIWLNSSFDGGRSLPKVLRTREIEKEFWKMEPDDKADLQNVD